MKYKIDDEMYTFNSHKIQCVKTVLLLLLFLPFYLIANTNQITKIVEGSVTDASGDGLIGVTVMIEGTSKGTLTNVEGKYSIEFNNQEDVLSFSYVGYSTKKLKIGDVRRLDVVLEESNKAIDEVVVVGYGYQKKETVIGAISSISTSDLVQTPVTNISNALAGRMSGLMAIQSNGEPGRNQSTLKIRGVATLNSKGEESAPLILVDGVERNTLDDLDPNEIASLNILKDASATAVFGVKGANGVILVTTRTGDRGKPKVSLSFNVGVQNPIHLPNLLNSYDYAVLKNEALANDGKASIFSEENLQHFKNGTDPVFHSSKNWIREFVKDLALQQQYNVNISGGTPVMKYFVSFGYVSQDGLYDSGDLDVGFSTNPKYERYNIRTNFDFSVSKNLTTSVRLGTSFSNSNYPNGATNSLFYNFLSYPPFSSPGIIDGKVISGFINDPLGAHGIENRGNSPYQNLLTKGYQDSFGNKLNLNWSFDYQLNFITEGLSSRVMIAYDNIYNHTATWTKSVDLYKAAIADLNDLSSVSFIQTSYDGNFGFNEDHSKWRKVYFEAALSYNRVFGDHIVTGLLLCNHSKEHSPKFKYNVPASLVGLVGRVTYSYKSRYLVEYNMGYNGSEQFPPSKRYGYFPAYSLGWILSEESFLPQNEVLTYLKIRGSYGEVGNDKTGGDRFLYLPSVYVYKNGQNNGYWFGTKGENLQKYTGSMEGKIGNPDVTWERAKKFNVGLELKLFKNNLSLSGDYFREHRDNILWERGTVPDLVAADLPKVNLGEVKNKGFEFDVSWRSKANEIDYWFGGNFSFARNKIVFKDEASMPYYWMNDTNFSLDQYKAYRTDGFFNYLGDVENRPYYNFSGNAVQRGDLKYIDINGDGIIDQSDIVPTGFSNLPESIYGFSVGAAYKGFDFSVLFQGVGNSSRFLNEMAGWAFDWNWRSTLSDFKERWSVERFENGEKISKPRLASNGSESVNAQRSDFLIHNSDYLRLKNAEIGYTFSTKSLRNVGVSSLRVYTNGSNLLTFTSLKNIDPESTRTSGAYYPLTRVFNLGVKVQF